MQHLVKLALEPEWEAVFEPSSFGFRPGRSVHDAAAAVKHGLGAENSNRPNRQTRCRWILDADIKSFFDEIEHSVILSRVPIFRRVIAGWLKAGVFTGEVYDPTETGTPQGGVISPLLANIALHGLEDLVKVHTPDKRDGAVLPMNRASTASTSQANTFRFCRRQVSTTVSKRSTYRLPAADCVPNDNFRQITA